MSENSMVTRNWPLEMSIFHTPRGAPSLIHKHKSMKLPDLGWLTVSRVFWFFRGWVCLFYFFHNMGQETVADLCRLSLHPHLMKSQTLIRDCGDSGVRARGPRYHPGDHEAGHWHCHLLPPLTPPPPCHQGQGLCNGLFSMFFLFYALE